MMKVWLLLCMRGSRALIFDSYGEPALWTSVSVLALGFVFGFICCSRKLSFAGLTHLILALQYTRWTPNLDYSTSASYKTYWQSMYLLFDPVTVVSPASSSVALNGVESGSFFSNSEEKFALIAAISVAAVVARVFVPKLASSYQLVSWVFLVTYMDIVLYASLTITQAEVPLVELAAAWVFVSVYIALTIGTWVATVRGRSFYWSFFTIEFKTIEVLIVRLYYPLLFLCRGLLAILYGTGFFFEYQYPLLVVLEAILILYVALFAPHKRWRNSVFCLFNHILVLGIASVPIIEDRKYTDEGDFICFAGVLSLILVALVWFGVDFAYTPRIRRTPITKVKHWSAPSVDSSIEKTQKNAEIVQEAINDQTIEHTEMPAVPIKKEQPMRKKTVFVRGRKSTSVQPRVTMKTAPPPLISRQNAPMFKFELPKELPNTSSMQPSIPKPRS